jgi:hypothetical protein
MIFEEQEQALEILCPKKDRWILKMDWNKQLSEKEKTAVQKQILKMRCRK